MERIEFATIETVFAKLDAGKTTSERLATHLLQRISELNPVIGAFSDVLTETALLEARASDARRATGKPLSKLDGIPIAVKDLIDTVPAVCSAGLEHLRDYRPEHDAEVVVRLRAAGAVILGVTESDPGGFSTETPKVRNPVAPDRTVGGSSGGSGAAVAAGLAFAAIGTDTGGSIRIPAACCAVFGLKPTFGRVSAQGVRPLASSLDHIGPIARSVADLELVQEIIDPDWKMKARSASGEPLRIGFCVTDQNVFAASMRDALYAVKAKFETMGVHIKEVQVPSGHEVFAYHMVNLPKEAALYHDGEFPDQWDRYPRIARDTIAMGLEVSNESFAIATGQRDQARGNIENAFAEFDLLIVPTLPVDVPKSGDISYEYEGNEISKLQATVWNTAIFNQTGHPVVSVPIFNEAGDLPISIQIVGAKDADEKLLHGAKLIEQALTSIVPHSEWLAERFDDNFPALNQRAV